MFCAKKVTKLPDFMVVKIPNIEITSKTKLSFQHNDTILLEFWVQFPASSDTVESVGGGSGGGGR
jgi:hypothetical protein